MTADDERNPFKASKAPRPATPIRGGGYLSVTVGGRRMIVSNGPGGPVDWDMWRQTPTAMLWEAVALSLGNEPGDQIPADPANFAAEYPKRLRIAQAHLSDKPGSALRLAKGIMGTPGESVGLPEFGAWALGMGWTLPIPFPRATSVPADKGERIKRPALIERHARQWPTIERDLKDASANGLSADAKAHGLGWWHEGAALAWAKARGRLAADDAPAYSVFPRTVHKIKG